MTRHHDPKETPALVLHCISKVYQEGDGNRVVLDNLDATFDRGEIVAVVGRSGSGKSTLLNVISGIDSPTSGEVIIDGSPLTHLNEHQRTLFRRRHIGFVFQFFNLIPTLTVKENLQLPLELIGPNTPVQRHAVGTLLDQIGLKDRGDSYPDALSGGEQQRVAIARAVIHRPRVLLADEPTGNLDQETGRHVMALLKQLARESAMTVILVTHSREVAGAAERVLTLADGRLKTPAHGETAP
jgi:putative ABC transport system ATP-binding protein